MPRWPKSGRRWWRPAAPRCSARPCGRPWNAWAGDAKKSVHAAERDTARVVALRRLFIEAIQEEEVTRFVFVGETSTNLTYCRRYGRAPAGQRLGQAVPLHGGPNGTLIAALTPEGLGALLTVEGAVNGDVFAAYLDQVLGPTLRRGDVVVLDNLSVHKVDGLAEIGGGYGVRLRYLPPYSPDFNPIELAFSKLKTWLRPLKARTRDALEQAIIAAAAWISDQDAKNWFDHCEYHVQ
ncbi:IS630 family transposase [Hymenobacter siberiensis]|uniref:IS630 family transposase n=1 Tax=Hymenobacter siberiensis TaxID=2848396 RepID=UPI001D0314C0|nr:IS630 family transposase [Hymenobacter siberiensis]